MQDIFSFAEELANAGFSELFEKEQSNDFGLPDFSGVQGVKSLEQILQERQARSQKDDVAKIWEFFSRYPKDKYWADKTRLSYSFLKHVDNIRYPYKSRWFGDSTKRFELGKVFELLLVGKFNRYEFEQLSSDEIAQCGEWAQNAMFCPEIKEAVETYRQQTVHCGELFGYRFKGKSDFDKPEKSHILDTKTTKHKTYEAFYKQCVDMAYFGQGVIYKAIATAKGYTIAGTSKTALANFVVNMGETENEIGEKELLRLLENLKYYGISQHFKS